MTTTTTENRPAELLIRFANPASTPSDYAGRRHFAVDLAEDGYWRVRGGSEYLRRFVDRALSANDLNDYRWTEV